MNRNELQRQYKKKQNDEDHIAKQDLQSEAGKFTHPRPSLAMFNK